MPTALPNYTIAGAFNAPGSIRLNPRTGEQTFLDALTGQWLPNAITQGQMPSLGAPPAIGNLPTYVHSSPNMGSSTGAGTPTSAGVAGGSAIGGMGQAGFGMATANPLAPTGIFRDYGPNQNMSLQEANDFYRNRVASAVPEYISPGAGAGAGMPVTPLVLRPLTTGGGFTGGAAMGFGGTQQMQQPTQRTRVYGPSFGTPLPGYSGRNS